MKPATNWHGAHQIVRFNWPSYLLAIAVIAACLFASLRGGRVTALSLVVLLPTAYWAIASIVVAHWIYDCSPLADWSFLADWLPSRPRRWLIVQTGFDPSYDRLRQMFPVGLGSVVDLYGTPSIGGASVRRARAQAARDSLPERPVDLPAEASTTDVILAAFSLHEIRIANARDTFFRRMADILAPGGRLLVVEHLRDRWNWLAFGPGFFHFLPEGEWQRCADGAGIRLVRTESITPFVRAFLWEKP